MSTHVEKIKSLIDRATHASTNDNEARTCALLAVKLIKKHNLTFKEESEKVEQPNYDSDPYMQNQVPFDPSTFVGEEVETFRNVHAKQNGICACCGKEYFKDTIVTRSEHHTTHFACKRWFVDKNAKSPYKT